MTRSRLPALDLFRLGAAVLVVAIHTSPLESISPDLDFWLTRVAARVAVPFFLMVSGFFLAKKDQEGIGRFLKKTLLIYLAAVIFYLPMNLYAGGFSPSDWLRGILWEGTLYHLWYFPALIWGVLFTRLLLHLGRRRALPIAAILYLIGLGGDSYYGIVSAFPVIRQFYDLIFSVTEYTRNGIFLAPLFLLLSAANIRLQPPLAAAGFCLTLSAMSAEAFWLHGAGVQRHDSMYLLLPLCMVCLFSLLVGCNSGRCRAARDISLLVYLLHPGCIVAVRGIARLTGTWPILVENSLGHFTAVLALSAGISALLYLFRPLPADSKSRSWREIDPEALRYNARVLRQAAGPDCELMAVVKADAYGHGAKTVASLLQKDGIRFFAVACLEEGLALRRAGIRGCILVLGWTDPRQAARLAHWRLTQTVADAAHGHALSKTGYNVRVHLAVDTGMHRLGLPADDLAAILEMYRLPGIRVEGIFSHLCVSDSLVADDIAYTKRQAESFRELIKKLKDRGISPGKTHLMASYGLLNCDEPSFDLARAGIALYGVYSDDAPVYHRLELHPVLSLYARVASVRVLSPGESAGYGRAFIAERPTRIAVAAIGYADGLPRCLGGRNGRVLVHGVACPIVGRICMDQLLIDVTDVEEVLPGDTVTLIGRDGSEVIRAETVAEQCGTITNELLSRLGARLPVVVRSSSSSAAFLKSLFS